MADTFNYKHGAAIAIPFSKSNLTTGESNTDLVLAGATTLYVAPVAGSVMAISARASPLRQHRRRSRRWRRGSLRSCLCPRQCRPDRGDDYS